MPGSSGEALVGAFVNSVAAAAAKRAAVLDVGANSGAWSERVMAAAAAANVADSVKLVLVEPQEP